MRSSNLNRKQTMAPEWLEPTVIILLLANPILLSIDAVLATWLLASQAVGYVAFSLRNHLQRKNRLMMLSCGSATVATAVLAINVLLAMPLESIDPGSTVVTAGAVAMPQPLQL